MKQYLQSNGPSFSMDLTSYLVRTISKLMEPTELHSIVENLLKLESV